MLGFILSRSANLSTLNLERWTILREFAHDPSFSLTDLPQVELDQVVDLDDE